MKILIFIKDCFVLIFYMILIVSCILNPWCLVFLVIFSALKDSKREVENETYIYNSAGRRFKVII